VTYEPDRELLDIRHHWGDAYDVMHPAPDLWLAIRKDDRTALRAETPADLWRAIREDYAARPVPRQQP
jgi:hypothetical protein